MLCSIIVPLYNKADFIEEALQSILNQTYQNFEVIVVDDGSKDEGAARVRAIEDKRVTLVQQANGGVSSARNKGIALAQGDLVCFLDADDWYLPQYLDKVVSMAKQYPEIRLLTAKFKLVNIDQGDAKFWDVPDTADIEIIDDLFSRWQGTLFHISSFAVRRNFLLQFQPCFPLGEQMGEDQDLFFRLAEQSAVAHCPLALTAYRVGLNDSLCATYQGSCVFPTHVRLEQRALNRQMPDRLRSSALRWVTDLRITSARRTLMAGQRYKSFKQLLAVSRGIVSIRWWLSLVMCAFATPDIVQRWENWRIQRAMQQLT
jgi:cellulose synthase/poly-beta-1,6-N-acetylglucosamine synthase-like glycosyltransferase